MPAGLFHAFHYGWIWEIHVALNGGLLPKGYYALPEQVVGRAVPDLLTLREREADRASEEGAWESGGGIAVAQAPPRVAVVDELDASHLVDVPEHRLAIRHMSDDRLIALIEIVSPGNKEKRAALDDFLDKIQLALSDALHLLILDVIPSTVGNARSIHAALWRRFDRIYQPPTDWPLELASYACGADGGVTAYVEPLTVGRPLPDMPLFLDTGHYINVPLGATYQTAWEQMPGPLRRRVAPVGEVT